MHFSCPRCVRCASVVQTALLPATTCSGDAAVLAHTPGPPDRPEREQGLLLVHARRADLLAALFDRLNEVQKKAGEVTAVEARTHRGQTYHLRRKAKDADEYYCVRG